MLEGVVVTGFADDIAMTVKARSPKEARSRIEWAFARVEKWLREHGFVLASYKTEMVVLTRQRWFGRDFSVNVRGTTIVASPHIKYLEVWIDSKLKFGEHLRRATEKAERIIAALSRLMPNVGGPREAKRRLLASVNNSILLYGAEVWADVLVRMGAQRRLNSVQRIGSLRIACAYRTVSSAAVMVIAGTIPVVLLARERREKFLTPEEVDEKRREGTYASWQAEWDESKVGRWTHRLIPQVRPWVDRGHGEINYYLTQFLSGHGQFNAYLHRMAVKSSPRCDYYPAVDDTVEHTFFNCDRWHQQRRQLESRLGFAATPDNVV